MCNLIGPAPPPGLTEAHRIGEPLLPSVADYYNNNSERHTLIVTAPAWSNSTLHAQMGVFTLCRGEIVRGDYVVSLDDIVKEEIAKATAPCPDLPLLKRLQLPTDLAPELLRLLSYENITAATMFPGADGVVKAMHEQWQWDIPPDQDDEF